MSYKSKKTNTGEVENIKIFNINLQSLQLNLGCWISITEDWLERL